MLEQQQGTLQGRVNMDASAVLCLTRVTALFDGVYATCRPISLRTGD